MSIAAIRRSKTRPAQRQSISRCAIP